MSDLDFELKKINEEIEKTKKEIEILEKTKELEGLRDRVKYLKTGEVPEYEDPRDW